MKKLICTWFLLVAMVVTAIVPAMADVALPGNVTEIEAQAFLNAAELTGVLTIPEGVTSIGTEAFMNCKGITKVTFPSTPISIGSKAFAGCTGLNGSTVVVGEGSTVAADAFDGCDITLTIGVPEGYPAIVPEMIQAEPTTLTIYDYWTYDDTRVTYPTEETQLMYDYHDWIEATYNVKIRQIQGGDWGNCAEKVIDFVSEPDGSLRAYIIEPGKVGSLIDDGVAASWGNYNLSGSKWNKATIDQNKIGGNVYGVSVGATEPRQLLYFNKHVLAEAGIDWNTIYDMQANGTWTWAAFEKMLKQVTRDTDNDGVNDIWGLIGCADDLYIMSVFVNGGSFFDFDANGKLQPTMDSKAAIDALNWARGIYHTYWMPEPEDANWDWYKDQWKEGNIGFYMYQAWGGFYNNSEMSDMEDEWGAVAFPVPNAGGTYLTVASENTTIIPNVYDAETVQMIAFFIDLWTNDTPGVDTSDSWIGNKYNLTDERAVDETYGMLRKNGHSVTDKTLLLGTQNDILGSNLLWRLGQEGYTPQSLINESMSSWEYLCDQFNHR